MTKRFRFTDHCVTLGLLSVLLCARCAVTQHNNEPRLNNLDTIRVQSMLITGASSGVPGIRVFKGIPYAIPPVGRLRWRPPQPVPSLNKIFRAINFGDNCMQGGGGPVAPTKPGEPANPYTSEYEIDKHDPQSEDCLCLNIWTPAKSPGDKVPVLVYIHGGGLGGGSGSIPLYDGEGLAKKGIIVVTINYRLAIFGYFSHAELRREDSKAINFGLLDQIEALKWIHNNIASFGGDPTRITIGGTSAGAWSVSALLCSPLAKGLFQRAIAESGGLFAPRDSARKMNPFYSVSEAEKEAARFMTDYHFRTLEELHKTPADELLSKSFNYGLIGDGYTLPKDIYAAFAEQKDPDIPLLIGWNAADARGFGWQARIFANVAAKSRKSGVYLYYFSKVAPGTVEEQALGAYHAAEIAYAYNNLNRWNRPWKEEDRKLSDLMSSYWVNFITTGNPNHHDLPEWPEYASDKERSLELGETIRIIPTPWDEEYDFFNKAFHR